MRSEPHPRQSGAGNRANRARVIQPYFTISKGSVYRNSPSTVGKLYNLVGTIAFAPQSINFAGQEKAKTGSFLNPQDQKRANIRSNSQPALRISDDYQMAIEESDLENRQPKCFFAARGVITHANAELQRTNSQFELFTTNETIEIYVPWNRQKYILNKIVPRRSRTTSMRRYTMLASQTCNEFAKELTGVGNADTDLKPIYANQRNNQLPSKSLYEDIQVIIAQLVAKAMNTEDANAPTFNRRGIVSDKEYNEMSSNEVARREADAVNEIARKYVEALKRRGNQNVLRSIGINEYAAPGIGDSFVTKTVYDTDMVSTDVTDLLTNRTFTPTWSYHFGGVVAKSGNDVVTMENYARGEEDKALTGKPPAKEDPRWYFQMYGLKHASQSFHRAQVATGGFANPMTFALRNPQRRAANQVAPIIPQPQPTPPRFTRGQVATASALLTLIASVVLKRYGLI
ncbi:MAG: hypothetical protein ICV60_16710 [Pyrinomonadaceae bacterium]|nr:hypothetical protein [Pyrinomonadaceae bacterium]